MSSGDWYKIAVQNTGIHRITYDDLLDYGIDPDNSTQSLSGFTVTETGCCPKTMMNFVTAMTFRRIQFCFWRGGRNF
ncbi:MAG: hypothetical protein R2764_20295 [Bacteroidales bacterium]